MNASHNPDSGQASLVIVNLTDLDAPGRQAVPFCTVTVADCAFTERTAAV